MNFLSMWQFWIGFGVGIFIGCIIGYFVAARCFISGQASRREGLDTITFLDTITDNLNKIISM